jgi:Raf kinase inhibitor-like YbhB/YbcL family protein
MIRLGFVAIALLALLSGAPARAADFTLTIPGLKAGDTLPNAYVFNNFGCTGENKSPALQWQNAPEGTKSFAVTVYDPDAPTGSGWWHWTVVNLPASLTALPENASMGDKLLPEGALQGRTDYAMTSYGGPCPPVGDKPHRYIFKIHALKVDKIDVPTEAPGAMIGYFLGVNALATAEVTYYYGR